MGAINCAAPLIILSKYSGRLCMEKEWMSTTGWHETVKGNPPVIGG